MSDAEALAVNAALSIPRSELQYRASRAGGAGGQHVNTSSTRIELLWDLPGSTAVSEALRVRLREKLANRLDAEGMIRVVASARRSQQQNRIAAEERLVDLLREAIAVPKPRRRTKPTRASKEKRLSEKKRHAERKQNRRRSGYD